MSDKIYLICEECFDTYYPGHPTKFAFKTKAEAVEFIEKCLSPGDSYEEWCPYYVKEVELASSFEKASEIFAKNAQKSTI